MRIKWNERTTADKCLVIFRLIASVAAFIFACLQLFKIYDSAINIAVPLMGLAFLLQAIQERKTNGKSVTVFLYCTAVFIFICSFVALFVE